MRSFIKRIQKLTVQIDSLREDMENKLSEMQYTFDNKSEKWKESEKWEEAQEDLELMQDCIDELQNSFDSIYRFSED